MCVSPYVGGEGEGEGKKKKKGYVRANNNNFVLLINIISDRRQRRGGQSRERVDLRRVDAGVAQVTSVFDEDGHDG